MTVVTSPRPAVRPTSLASPPAPAAPAFDLDALAAEVETRGVRGADPRGIRELARRARARGASRVLVEVLTGAREPDVARVRAFARLSAALALQTAGGPPVPAPR